MQITWVNFNNDCRNAKEAAAIPGGARLSPLDEVEMQDQKGQQDPGRSPVRWQRTSSMSPMSRMMRLAMNFPESLPAQCSQPRLQRCTRRSSGCRFARARPSDLSHGFWSTRVVTGHAAPEPEVSLSLTRWKQRLGRKVWCKLRARLDGGRFVLGSSVTAVLGSVTTAEGLGISTGRVLHSARRTLGDVCIRNMRRRRPAETRCKVVRVEARLRLTGCATPQTSTSLEPEDCIPKAKAKAFLAGPWRHALL